MKLPETLDEAIERIFDLEIENANLKGMLKERGQQISSSPAPDSTEGGHILHGGKSGRSTAARKLWTQAGHSLPPKGSMLVIVCDEPDCIEPSHREVMTKEESRRFNTDRVVKEALSLGHNKAFDLIMDQTANISGGHMVVKDGSGMIHLPSGRNIGAAKLSVWADEEAPTFPKTVTRTCAEDGCIEAAHLRVTSA